MTIQLQLSSLCLMRVISFIRYCREFKHTESPLKETMIGSVGGGGGEGGGIIADFVSMLCTTDSALS